MNAIRHAGLTFDQDFQRDYGKLIVDFYTSHRSDARVLTFGNAYLYGGFFDTCAALLERALPDFNYRLLRYGLIVIFAAVGILYAGRAAALVRGPWAGLCAGACLAAVPSFAGQALFNPKDVPFAALFMVAIYYAMRIFAEDPAMEPCSTWFKLALSAGLCLGVRIGGLLIWCFVAAALSLWLGQLAFLRETFSGRERLRRAARTVTCVSGAAALAILIATAFWPYLQAHTIRRLLSVLHENSQFVWDGPILFDGQVLRASQIGRRYLPTWMWISLPPFLWVGLCACGLIPFHRRATMVMQRRSLSVFIVALSFVFPVVYAIVKGVILYDGLRQFLFVLPPMAVMAGVGWHTLATFVQSRLGSALAVILFIGGLAEPVAWIARSQCYAYTYFSPLVGGIRQASYRFETDFWGLSHRRAAEWLDAYRHQRGRDVLIVRMRGPWTEWPLLAPFLEWPIHVRVAELREHADLDIIFSRSLLPGTWMEGPGILFREELVSGQVPFIVIREANSDVSIDESTSPPAPPAPVSP